MRIIAALKWAMLVCFIIMSFKKVESIVMPPCNGPYC
jgi:hypothetical protein